MALMRHTLQVGHLDYFGAAGDDGPRPGLTQSKDADHVQGYPHPYHTHAQICVGIQPCRGWCGFGNAGRIRGISGRTSGRLIAKSISIKGQGCRSGRGAAPAIARTKTGLDAGLIDLCDQFVSIETERWLLYEHDEYAPDFGPNNGRYRQLGDEQERLIEMIDECQSPTTPAGHAAIARAALTWVSRDGEGNVVCGHFGDELMVQIAEGLASDFVWPPRAGSCSAAHWAPPPSPKEIAENKAAHDAQAASRDAKIQAKRRAEESERHRSETPSLMTDDELRGQIKATRKFKANLDRINDGLAGEMARRGLA